jgi:hypothetical protein
VADVDSAGQLHRVARPVRIAVEVLDDFENSGAAEALKRLRVRVFRPFLRPVERKANTIQTVDPSMRLARIYAIDSEPLPYTRSGIGRFDAPNGEYGVLYAAGDAHCAFVETFGQDLGYRLVAQTELAIRGLAEIHPARALRLVDLTGRGLAALGADGRLCTGDYAVAQRWSRALWQHPDHTDGLLWRSRFIHRAPALSARCTGRG